MKQLIVENKVGCHFELRKTIKKSKERGGTLSIELLDNDFVVLLQNYTYLTVMLTVPYRSLNHRRKTGFAGYNNIIKIIINSLLHKRNKISGKDFNTNVISHIKKVNDQEVIYVWFSFRVGKKEDFKIVEYENLLSLREMIIKNVSSTNPYQYRYL